MAPKKQNAPKADSLDTRLALLAELETQFGQARASLEEQRLQEQQLLRTIDVSNPADFSLLSGVRVKLEIFPRKISALEEQIGALRGELDADLTALSTQVDTAFASFLDRARSRAAEALGAFHSVPHERAELTARINGGSPFVEIHSRAQTARYRLSQHMDHPALAAAELQGCLNDLANL